MSSLPLSVDSWPYSQDISALLSANVGPAGLSESRFQTALARIDQGIETVRQAFKADKLPFLESANWEHDLAEVTQAAASFQGFEEVIVLGTGGSSLGGRALQAMQGRQGSQNGTRLSIVTNIDPFSFEQLIDRQNWQKTGVIAISKSGHTVETLMQLYTILPLMRRTIAPAQDIANHLIMITDPGDNPLRSLAERLKARILDHPQAIGGRYSVLTVVGALPALIAGLDPRLVREGARMVRDQTLKSGKAMDCQPGIGAAALSELHNAQSQEATGLTGHVMLAYSDRLGSLARWHRQLWAESLGKNGMGATPIYATGPVDQHSQLQLWIDGPRDKVFTVLGTPRLSGQFCLDEDELARDDRLSYLSGHRLGDLMYAAMRATGESLTAHGCPLRWFEIPHINEQAMGALFMHFMLETVLMADAMGVNAFDQPAVEDGKQRIHRYLANRFTL